MPNVHHNAFKPAFATTILLPCSTLAIAIIVSTIEYRFS